MDIENTILTINGQKYLVMETIDYQEKKYVYLINRTDKTDAIFREVIMGDGLKLCQVEPNLFSSKIYPLFLKKFKTYVDET